MIFAIQNICAKNSQTKSKDKASIGQNNKPVMGTLQHFTCLQLEKKGTNDYNHYYYYLPNTKIPKTE